LALKVLRLGIVFQLLFVLLLTVGNFVRIFIIDHYSVYPIAFFELFLGIGSLSCGVYGLIKTEKPILSLWLICFGLLICVFFIVVYLLPEGDIPPEITWFYSE
jgi:hypothetical protein